MRRAGILRRRHQAGRAWPGRAARSPPATLARCARGGAWGGPHHVSPSVLSLSQATECGTIYRVAEISELADDRARARRRRAHGRRAARQCARAHECLARRGHLEGRRRRALVRRHQGRRDGRGGGDLLRSASAAPTCRTGASAAARSPRSTASSRRRWRPILAGRSVAEACAPRQRDGGRACRRTDRGRLQAGMAGRGERGVRAALGRRSTSGSRPPAPPTIRGSRRACRRSFGRGGSNRWCGFVTSFQTTQDDVDRFLATIRA